MLEIRKTAVSFDEQDLMELERIVQIATRKRRSGLLINIFMTEYYILSRAD